VPSLSLGYGAFAIALLLCYVITLRYREKITVKYNYSGMGRQFVEETFCLTGELSEYLLTSAYT